MRATLAVLTICGAISFGTFAMAQDRPVVIVELFTSQGCSSCPPADAFLGELAEHDGVLPLAMHVDYWDYIGWKDTFARPEHTLRQKAYAYGFGTRSIYTPQMVVGGADQVVGSHVMQIMEILHRHQDGAQNVAMKVIKGDNGARLLRVERQTHRNLPTALFIQLVRFIPKATVDIKRGENAGRTITSTNVVTDISSFGSWDGKSAVEFELPTPVAPDGQDAAVVLQSETKGGYPGPILAAIRLD